MGDRQPRSAFEYFSVYRMSVLSVGDAQRRNVGGAAVVNFSLEKREGRKKKKHKWAHSPVGLCLDAVIRTQTFSFCVAVMVPVYNHTGFFKQSLVF